MRSKELNPVDPAVVPRREPHPDLRIDTGDGSEPVTGEEWNSSLARMCVLHPDKVKPSDDEERELVERIRHDPETRRLVSELRAQVAAAAASEPTMASRGQHGREPRRRRSVRSNPRRSRAPGSNSDDDPHLEPGLRVIGVSEFRRQLEVAGE
jgi:hypothetical protein